MRMPAFDENGHSLLPELLFVFFFAVFLFLRWKSWRNCEIPIGIFVRLRRLRYLVAFVAYFARSFGAGHSELVLGGVDFDIGRLGALTWDDDIFTLLETWKIQIVSTGNIICDTWFSDYYKSNLETWMNKSIQEITLYLTVKFEKINNFWKISYKFAKKKFFRIKSPKNLKKNIFQWNSLHSANICARENAHCKGERIDESTCKTPLATACSPNEFCKN